MRAELLEEPSGSSAHPSYIIMEPTVLEARNITKVFPGVKPLDDVSFALHKNEIHAIVGENGAGKSTLIKILTGIYKQEKRDRASRREGGDV